MPTVRPIVLLAFADARNDLASLKVEGWSLTDQFRELKQRGVIDDVMVEPHASLERIYSIFQKHGDRIALFHFGGHADKDHLLLTSAFEPRPAYAEGIATLLGQQRGLKLVFLNGCSTRHQVKRLLDAGVPAVIATARAIDDRAATKFAVAFYEALTTGSSDENRKITGGCGLGRAFAAAEGLVRAAHGGNPRHILAKAPTAFDNFDDDGWPWRAQYNSDKYENADLWNLFEDNPLSNLPLPGDIDWPSDPYRSLESFERDHARIFFGRERAIRELHDLLTLPAESAESRLILFFGQSGVGKTSVLKAGLLPRVEALFATRPCRRSDQEGLLRTLRAQLGPSAHPSDLGAAWVQLEHHEGRPLLVVLDQAEEAFTRPLADCRPVDEVRELFKALREAFARARAERPQGRLILSFRKEWLAEFDAIRRAVGLDAKAMPLHPLDPAGVVAAIEGPADHYGVIIRPDRGGVKPGETTLAEFMCHDLFDTLADSQTEQESPIAPTLQILLTRMWEEAKAHRRLRGLPCFDRELYQELKGKAFRLDEVIQEQFDKIAEVEDLRKAVENGLLLDFLEAFTTHEGTANTRTHEQIHDRYKDRPAKQFDDLIEACQNCYLLAHVGVGADGTAAYRLTHDTLAPLLRERLRVSSAWAQRARHALEGRMATWEGKPTDPMLDREDLESVKKGLPWMRVLERKELALLEASRLAEEDRAKRDAERERLLHDAREGEEKALQMEKEANQRLQAAIRGLRRSSNKLRGALAATGLLAGLAVGLGFWAQGNYVQSQRNLAMARIEQGTNLCMSGEVTRGINTLVSAYAAAEKDGALRETARRLISGWSRGLGTPLHHDAPVQAVAFSHDGKLAITGTWDRWARVWDVASGRPIGSPLKHGERVLAVAISQDGKIAATGSEDHTARFWNTTTGEQVGESVQHAGPVVEVCPSGKPHLYGGPRARDDERGTLWKRTSWLVQTAKGSEFGRERANVGHRPWSGVRGRSAVGRPPPVPGRSSAPGAQRLRVSDGAPGRLTRPRPYLSGMTTAPGYALGSAPDQGHTVGMAINERSTQGRLRGATTLLRPGTRPLQGATNGR
jgi:hypothetical protein